MDVANKFFAHADLTEQIIAAAIAVSNELGSGFLEKVYENALVIELRRRGLKVAQQVRMNIVYQGQVVGEYVADLVVEGLVLVEVKATLHDDPVFSAVVINYLRATGLPVALLLNFGRPRLHVKRLVSPDLKEVSGAEVGPDIS